MKINFRNLKEDEIEVRVSTINEKGASLLLYKTARVDSAILDETVGPMNWSNEYKEIKGNMYCGITIYDRENNTSVTKWNCGTESFSEAQKGEASDAFKRAGFTWGIGVELYNSPFIYIPANKMNITEVKGKKTTYDKFTVEKIKTNDKKEIEGLSIINQKGERVFLLKPKGAANEDNK